MLKVRRITSHLELSTGVVNVSRQRKHSSKAGSASDEGYNIVHVVETSSGTFHSMILFLCWNRDSPVINQDYCQKKLHSAVASIVPKPKLNNEKEGELKSV